MYESENGPELEKKTPTTHREGAGTQAQIEASKGAVEAGLHAALEPKQSEVQVKGDVCVIGLADKTYLDEAHIRQVEQGIFDSFDGAGCNNAVLDFHNVSYMSSRMIGCVIQLAARVRQRKGVLKMCSVAPKVFAAFSVTRMDDCYKFYETREQAIASFQARE